MLSHNSTRAFERKQVKDAQAFKPLKASKAPLWRTHARDVLSQSNKLTRAPGNGPHPNESWQTHGRHALPGEANEWHRSINNNINYTRSKQHRIIIDEKCKMDVRASSVKWIKL